MEYKDAVTEYQKILEIKQILKIQFPEYKKYIILADDICRITFISKKDLENFNKCLLFENMGINESNVNEKLQDLVILNQRYGGIELQEYLRQQTQKNISIILQNMSVLLIACISRLNKLGIYHMDLKADNVLVDKQQLYIIDWGISRINPRIEQFEHYKNFSYNVPFGRVLFGNKFELWKFKISETEARKHVTLFMKNYEEEMSHFRIIKRAMTFLNKNDYVEKYLINILTKYTKDEYFKIYLHNIDIWGFVFSIIELLNNYEIRDYTFKQNIYMLLNYLYTHTGYLDVQKIASDLKSLSNNLITPKYSTTKYSNFTKTKKKNNI
jgi:serine/threonine protein kinase